MSRLFVNTIIFVSDIHCSKKFYAELLGINIAKDLGAIVFLVFFENNFVLHCANSIQNTIFKERTVEPLKAQGHNNVLVYFECSSLDELESLFNDIKEHIRLIHGIETQEWGQKVFRFYDPDGHIVEFGEPMVDSENS